MDEKITYNITQSSVCVRCRALLVHGLQKSLRNADPIAGAISFHESAEYQPGFICFGKFYISALKKINPGGNYSK